MRSATTRPGRRRLAAALGVVRARPRLFVSAAAGLAAIALLAFTDWRLATRLLVGWDVGVVLYLVLALELFARSDIHQIRRRAAVQDDGRLAVLVLTVAAAMASMGAIFAELGSGRGPSQLALAAGTIFASWAFVHTMFALHYAHEFYGGPEGRVGGMTFPGDDAPDYWDFAYFAFVIGMCAQVSDVVVSAKATRRTVLAHSIVAFVFNVALLALMVNIAGSEI